MNPIRSPRAALAALALLLVPALLAAAPAAADVVAMADGRRFEGEIIMEDDTTLVIDSRINGTIRATLRLPRIDVASIERKPLPDGFFDPPPPRVEERESEPDAARDAGLYLEIPIVGAFGRDVFADGVAATLAYARRHRIEHVVLVVDSAGGDIDEARRLYGVLRRHARQLRLHAIIRRCIDGALAVPVWCETIVLAPGALAGGSTPDETMDPAMASEERLMRVQIAAEVARDVQQRGGDSTVIRAMLDPLESIAGWRDEQGAMHVDVAAPSGLPADRLVFAAPSGQILLLDESQLAALGFRRGGGAAADLGAILGVDDWTKESTYGERKMVEFASSRAIEAARDEAKYAALVQKNLERREVAERAIEHNLREAAAWDPNQGDYERYAKRWRWQGGGFYRARSSWSMDARNTWRDRTDAASGFLRRAGEAIVAMQRLDREAVELNLEPSFPAGELAWMETDVRTKLDFLARHRNRTQG